jgi:hypothetical protein
MTVQLIHARRRRFFPLVLAGLVAASALTGCQAAPPDYDAETAKAFQATVLSVTQAVADGELQAARDILVAFDTDLDKAAADGTVTFARHQRIDAALAVVLADVDAAIAAQAPAPEPVVTPEPEPVTPTEPVTDEPVTPDNTGPGNNGNSGNGKKDKAPKKDK